MRIKPSIYFKFIFSLLQLRKKLTIMYVLRMKNTEAEDANDALTYVKTFRCLENVYDYLKLLKINIIYPTPEQLNNCPSQSETITVPIDEKCCYEICHVNDGL